MPHAKQIANEIKKELTLEDLPKDVLDTERWNLMRNRLEPIFNNFLIHEKEREELTDKVIHELRSKLTKEKPRDPSEKTAETYPESEKATEHHTENYDHFDQPELEKKVDNQGKTYFEIKNR